MKKAKLVTIMAVIGGMSLFTACSDDDDYVQMPGDGLTAKTYTMADGLDVTLNGDVAYGQTVTFVPGQNGNATITIKGADLNINDLMGGASAAAHAQVGLTFPTASLIPGSTTLEIPVQLSLDNGVNTFSGTSATEYCTFNYTGSVTPESLSLDITGLKLKNTSLAGTYDLPEMDDKYYNITRLEWDSEEQASVELSPGFAIKLPMKALFVMMFYGYDLVEIDGEKMKVFDALCKVLKSVTFGEDGSVTAVYADTKTPGLPEIVSPKGLAQYVVTSDNQIRLILNPSAIIAASASKAADDSAEGSGNDDLASLMPKLLPVIENVLPKIMPMLSQGIPVNYGPALLDEDGDNVTTPSDNPNYKSFYLDTNTLLPLLKDISPLLKDDEVIAVISNLASQDPAMGGMASMLPGLLKSLYGVIDTTSKVEIGLNLMKR